MVCSDIYLSELILVHLFGLPYPPKISFLAFGAKTGSSIGVKTRQIREIFNFSAKKRRIF